MRNDKSVEQHPLEAGWIEVQIGQAKQAIFEDYGLPFASSRGAPSLPPATDAVEPVVHHCDGPGDSPGGDRWRGLHTVAGLDIGYQNEGCVPEEGEAPEKAVACLAVLSFPELKVLYTVIKVVELAGLPYVPGFLSFREACLAELVLEVVTESAGRAVPQVVFVDGNGRLHPRQAGSAVAVGVKTGLPTIGVAKKYFPVHAITPDLNAGPATPPAALPPPSHLATRHSLRLATRSLLARRGDWLGLSAASPAAPVTPPASPSGYLGAALRSSPHAVGANPVFVSSGHRVGLGTALELVLACCAEARVPEPIRQADLIGRAEVKRLWG